MSSVDWHGWHIALANVVKQQHSIHSLTYLLKGLENLVGARSGIITRYSSGQRPLVTHQRLQANDNAKLLIDKYTNEAYVLDPFYRQVTDNQVTGVFTLNQLAPHGFEESEYYRQYYSLLDVGDEVCLFIRHSTTDLVGISLAKHIDGPSFDKEHISVLEAVFPIVDMLINKWFCSSKSPVGLESQLDNALEQFGSSVLTPRECQVLQFSLRGYSIKFIAEKLQNSVETIKHHKKNIHTKLDIKSQSELFNLFITSVKMVTSDYRGDPLKLLK